MKAKKIGENNDKASRSNSIGISQTYKLLGDDKWGIKKGNPGKAPKMLWAAIGEVFCIPLRLVFYSNIPMESVP